MDSLKAALLSNTFSVEAAKRRIGLLQRVLESLFYTKAEGDATPEERYSAALAVEATPEDHTAVALWGTAWLTAFSEQTFHTNIAELHTWLEGLPRVTVYVPAVLDADGEETMGEWCRKELSPNHMLDFEIDAMTLGGCAVISGGKLYDYSFTPRLRKMPEVIREVLDSYAT